MGLHYFVCTSYNNNIHGLNRFAGVHRICNVTVWRAGYFKFLNPRKKKYIYIILLGVNNGVFVYFSLNLFSVKKKKNNHNVTSGDQRFYIRVIHCNIVVLLNIQLIFFFFK